MPIANPERLKYPFQAVNSWAFNVFPKRVVATAELDNVITAYKQYPQGNLDITSTVDWADVEVGMMVEVSRAGQVYYRGAIRRLGSMSKLYLAGFSRAESGILNLNTAVEWADGDTVTVYDVRIPFSFWSRIDLETNKILKQWSESVYYDDAPTISKTEYPLPVANLGAWQRGVVDPDTGVATLTHDASASTVWRGSSFTVDWILPTGAALASGYALTDEVIEVEYDPGVYIIGCTVTEVGGSTPARERTAWRYVWAIDGDTQLDTSATIPFQITSDDADVQKGRTVILTAQSNTSMASTLYLGAPVLMTYDYRFSDDGWITTVTVPESSQSFAGYISAIETITDDGEVQTLSIRVESPMAVLERLGIATQVLRVRVDGNRWFKTIDASGKLGNVAYLVYYLLDHHAPFSMQLHDFEYSALTPFQKYEFRIDAQGIASAVQQAAAFCLGGTAGVKSEGVITLKRDPAIESNTYNSGLDDYLTLDGDLVANNLTYARADWQRLPDVRCGFFVTGVTSTPKAFVARPKLGAPAIGSGGIPNGPNFIALTKVDGRDRVGNYFQQQNAALAQLEVEMVGMQDVFDPCAPRLYTLDFDDYDAYNFGLLNNKQFYCVKVTRDWDVDELDTVVRLRVTFAPVSRGSRAKIEPQPAIVVPDSFIPTTSQPQTTVTPDPDTFEVVELPDGAPSGGVYVPPPTVDWTWFFDFRVDNGGFSQVGNGTWVDTVGWVSARSQSTSGPIVIAYDINIALTVADLTDLRGMRLYYTCTEIGENSPPYDPVVFLQTSAFPGPPDSQTPVVLGTSTALLQTPTGAGATLTSLRAGTRIGIAISAPDPGGRIVYTGLLVYGVGTVPPEFVYGAPGDPLTGTWEGTDVTTDAGNERKVADIYQNFDPARNIRRLYINYDLTIGTVNDEDAYCLRIFHVDDDGGETQLISLSFAQMDTRQGSGRTYTYNGSMKMEGVRVSLSSSLVDSGDTPDGTCVINAIDWDEVDS